MTPILMVLHRSCLIAAATGFAIVAIQPAFAQSEPGPYAVARAGVQIDADLKGQRAAGTATPGRTGASPSLVTTGVLPANVDAKPGFTGELGMGYDFGGFRVEGTVGHDTAALNARRLSNGNYVGGGRLKSLDLGVAGYVDLNPNGRLNPFVGAGIGASRVDLLASRLALPTSPAIGAQAIPAGQVAGTRVKDRDWGLRWHLDAGVGYALTPKTTLEVAGRYTRTTGLDFVSQTRATAAGALATQAYRPRTSSTSVMVGLRQKF